MVETASTATGEIVRSWSTSAETVWASIEDLSGREAFYVAQRQAKATSRIVMRYTTSIDAKARIVFEGEEYLVESYLDPGMKHKELYIMAIKVVS
jgi:SPP1 family predicted phage head-tail adaptor